MDIPNLNKERKNRRKPTLDITTTMYGKVPPQAKELEDVVLGACMLQKNAFDNVAEIISPESFYVDAHQKIFASFQSLAQKSMPIDMLTVIEELKIREELDIIGGPYYISKLTKDVSGAANIETHARIIQQKFLSREVIRIGGEMITEAYEDATDVFDLIEATETKVFNIANSSSRNNFEDLGSVLVKTVQRIDDLRNAQDDISGVPSCFHELDRVTHGWQATDLIILAARPSVGKTAFALNLARNAALYRQKPTPVAFFSLEMSAGQLSQRILSSESDIMLERITSGKMEDYHMQQLYSKGIVKLSDAPFYIDDTAALNIFEFRAKARRLVSKHKVGLIIVDYLQLMTVERENRNTNREQEISKISRELKRVAKELHVPVIALSQLSRDIEKRSQKVPQLADLRESGAIEQDADVVMFLYRPSEEERQSDVDLATSGMLKIAKHRNGKLESFAFDVKNEVQRWEEIGVLNNNHSNWKRVDTKPAATPPAAYSPPPPSRPTGPSDPNDDLPF